MADDVVLNPGAGGDTIAADDVAGVKYQVVKLAVGADGAAALVANANPIPISDAGGAITVDGTVAVSGTVAVTDNSGSLTVDNAGTFAVQAAQSGTWNVTNVSGTVSLPTGAATAAKQPALGTAGTASTDVLSVQGIASMTPLQVGDNSASLTVDAPVGTPIFVRLSDGSSAIATLPVSLASVPSHAVTNAGTFAVQESGSALTALQLIDNIVAVEDAVAGSGYSGVPLLAVRQDSQTALAADGDFISPTIDSAGGLRVSIVAGAGSGGTASADDADFTAGTTSGTPAMGVYESTPTTVTDGDLGTVGITANRAMKVAIASGGIAGIAEDSAAAGGEEGIMMLAVRRDSASSGVSADGDFAALSVTSDGSLRVSGGGGGTQYAVDTAGGGTDTGTLALAVRDDALATLTPVDGDYTQLRTNARGAQWVCLDSTAAQNVTVASALPAGTNAIGKLAANSGVDIGDVDVTSLPNVTLAAGTNTNEVVGDAAHDAAIAGNPLRIAGRALTSDYTAVAAGDTADLITTLLGKLVTMPYANPANTWSYAAASGGITNTTAVTVKAAAGAGIRNYVTSMDVINGHATVDTEVAIRDGAAGTVLWRGFAKAAGGGVSRKFEPPLRGTANTLLEVVNITTGSATYFNLSGFVAAE